MAIDKILCWRIKNTDSDLKVHDESYIMQISYLYASGFPVRQTSRNNNKLIQNSFCCKSEEKQTIARTTRIGASNLQREIWRPVFNIKTLTFSHCLRTKNASKEVANAYRGESRGISVEIEFPLKVSGICLF